ncbi:GNAT family N-acetyltransferase [Arthrobacter sp. UYCo732]|uniref:GNAT family N-acetyltransferase n=1 Tax=Arthrobacter sp. UYCo732 TaxID=3156336 RepID=UPI00339831F2
MNFLEPVTLTGRHVILEQLTPGHHDGLMAAARDGELWKLWYAAVPRPEEMAAEIHRRLAMQEQRSMLPFTTRLIDPATGGPGRIIGMTTYCNVDAATPRVEIGYTWQSREAIARLGAKQDGVLRSHRRTSDGVLRDKMVFSILEHEWPMVRNGLEHRLAKRA